MPELPDLPPTNEGFLVRSEWTNYKAGRKIARDYLDINQYTGPAPVPIRQYAEAVKAQCLPPNWLTTERLSQAYTHMVLRNEVLNQLGPAVNAGKSFLIYGQPGNGKTYLAEALF